MFTIAPMQAGPGTETLARLARIGTATFGHILHAGFPDRAGAAVVPGKRIAGRAINVPVQIGGATVNPGDAILADDCGVVVLDTAAIPDLMARTEAMEAREPEVIARLQAGEALADITGATKLIFPADV